MNCVSGKSRQFLVIGLILIGLATLRFLFSGSTAREPQSEAQSIRATQNRAAQDGRNRNWEVVESFQFLGRNDSIRSKGVYLSTRLRKKAFGSELLSGNQKVYVSMTTIHDRLYGICETVKSLLEGSVLPDHIYLFVSKEAYLLDVGISEEYLIETLECLKFLMVEYPFISVVYTENIGPHRKLLPLLNRKWNEDCVIVTVDDHEIYPVSALAALLYDYVHSNKGSVVALRSRRMAVCNQGPPYALAPYTNKAGHGLWPESPPGLQEMLTLPTGMGGILYRPRFFHPVIFHRALLNLTATGDDLMFRLAAMAKGTEVVTTCAPDADNSQRACPLQIATLANFIASSKKRIEDFSPGESVPAKRVIPSPSKAARNNTRPPANYYSLPLLNDMDEDNPFRRRTLRGTTESRQTDPRKISSLASMFNTAGGNNVMWDSAVQYLAKQRVLDFHELLQERFQEERSNCLLSHEVFRRVAPEEESGMVWQTWKTVESSMRVYLQNLYNKDCGIQACDAKNS